MEILLLATCLIVMAAVARSLFPSDQTAAPSGTEGGGGGETKSASASEDVDSEDTAPDTASDTDSEGAANYIAYSEKYSDQEFEYRHVILPRSIARKVPKNQLLSEKKWRKLGVQQSLGWKHYAVHAPEPHILLFRRPLGTNPATGNIDATLQKQALDIYMEEYG